MKHRVFLREYAKKLGWTSRLRHHSGRLFGDFMSWNTPSGRVVCHLFPTHASFYCPGNLQNGFRIAKALRFRAGAGTTIKKEGRSITVEFVTAERVANA